MTDGTRTRDSQYHKLELYQLSYGHHEGCTFCQIGVRVPPLGFVPAAPCRFEVLPAIPGTIVRSTGDAMRPSAEISQSQNPPL